VADFGARGPKRGGGDAPAKPSRGGLWGIVDKVLQNVSVSVSVPHAGDRAEPVRQEREEAGEELKYRTSDGREGQAPAERVERSRHHIARQVDRRLGVQRKATGAAGADVDIPTGGGSPLPADVSRKMSPRLGADLSDVRVHTGSSSTHAANELGARAFTVGRDVHFNAGEFAPGSKEGDKLLAHELTHVVQGARGGVQRKPAEEGGEHAAGEHAGHDVSHPDEPHEKEADAVAEHVAGDLHGDHGAAGNAEGTAAGAGDAAAKPAASAGGKQVHRSPLPSLATVSGGRRIMRAAKKTSGASSSTAKSAGSSTAKPAAGSTAKPAGGATAGTATPPPPPPAIVTDKMLSSAKTLKADPATKSTTIDGVEAGAKITAAEAALPPKQDPRTPKVQKKFDQVKGVLDQLRAKLADDKTVKTNELEKLGKQVMGYIKAIGGEFKVDDLGAPLPKFPAPTPAPYGPDDPKQAEVPDGSRTHHHVPQVELASSLVTPLKEAAASMPATTTGKRKVLNPAAKNITDAVTKIEGFGHGKGLSAIWIHSSTHVNRGAPAVHNSGIRAELTRRLEADAAKADEERKLIINRTGGKLSVKPQGMQFEDFLEKCKEQAQKNVNAKKKADAEAAIGKAEAEEKDVSKKAETDVVATTKAVLKEQLRLAFDGALAQGMTALEVALSVSFVDGDRGEHAGPLATVRTAAPELWKAILTCAE